MRLSMSIDAPLGEHSLELPIIRQTFRATREGWCYHHVPPLSQAASAHSDRAGGGHKNPAASELATEPAADAPVRREVENG